MTCNTRMQPGFCLVSLFLIGTTAMYKKTTTCNIVFFYHGVLHFYRPVQLLDCKQKGCSGLSVGVLSRLIINSCVCPVLNNSRKNNGHLTLFSDPSESGRSCTRGGSVCYVKCVLFPWEQRY